MQRAIPARAHRSKTELILKNFSIGICRKISIVGTKAAILTEPLGSTCLPRVLKHQSSERTRYTAFPRPATFIVMPIIFTAIGSASRDAVAPRHKDIVESLLLIAEPLSFVHIPLLLHHLRQHLALSVGHLVHLHLLVALLFQRL